MSRLSIGKLAKATNVSVDTIRFYEKRGLLPAPARRPSGFREYSFFDIKRLMFVRRARTLGFAIEEIAELLSLCPEQTIAVTAQIIDRKLEVIEIKIAQLQRWRTALERVLQDVELRGHTTRSILDLLDDHPTANVPKERFHDQP